MSAALIVENIAISVQNCTINYGHVVKVIHLFYSKRCEVVCYYL